MRRFGRGRQLATKAGDPSSSPQNPHGWNERTDPGNSSSDFH